LAASAGAAAQAATASAMRIVLRFRVMMRRERP
jgi:hypothetical protein